jgi:hypothetical protein
VSQESSSVTGILMRDFSAVRTGDAPGLHLRAGRAFKIQRRLETDEANLRWS